MLLAKELYCSSAPLSRGRSKGALTRKPAGICPVKAYQISRCSRTYTTRAVMSPPSTDSNALKTYAYQDLSEEQTRSLLMRPRVDFSSILNTVSF